MDPTRTPSQVLDELVESTNAHNLDRLVDCFATDYVLTDPVHPARSFTGCAQVRKNWEKIFAAMPGLRVEPQQQAVTSDGFWLEASQVGTRQDGFQLDGRMVFIATVSGGRITGAHIYLAQAESGGPDIDTVVAAMAGTPATGAAEPTPGTPS